jgi:hypothetical protein
VLLTRDDEKVAVAEARKLGSPYRRGEPPIPSGPRFLIRGPFLQAQMFQVPRGLQRRYLQWRIQLQKALFDSNTARHGSDAMVRLFPKSSVKNRFICSKASLAGDLG